MPDKKKLTPLQARMKKAKIDFKSDAEIEVWEKDTGQQMIKDAVDQVKDIIGKQIEPPEQLLFSFIPTTMTRTSPFFPMSKREMKNRPYEELTWETPWGRITVNGKRLSVYDETVLLSLLVLVAKHRSESFETTQHELCRIANVNPCRDTYNAIMNSIDRLTGTKIRLDKIEGKGSKKKFKMLMTSTILSGCAANPDTGKLQVSVNPYFLQMYTESFITNINLELRASLAGDITKALYRFYAGQKNRKFSCHVLTLAKAVNINMDLPIRKIRERIRKAHQELKNRGFLTKGIISKNDVVTIWKAGESLPQKMT